MRLKKLPYYLLILVAIAALASFLRQRRRPIPLPPGLSFVLENPLTNAVVGERRLISHFRLTPGMRVLDAGCGPGRLSVPVARAVAPGGEVVALDGQPEMLDRLRRRLAVEGVTNVRPVQATLGEGTLPAESFDRILLVMVLGEVRGRDAALRELQSTLKPGGLLCIAEALGDPDYHRPSTVRREAEAAGLQFVERRGGPLVFTMSFTRR